MHGKKDKFNKLEYKKKYDIRDLAKNHDKMGKVITLSEEEDKKLRNILNNNLKVGI